MAKNGAARFVTMDSGESTPAHASTSDHFIVQMEGEVEFTMPELGESYRLVPRDLLYIPAQVEYRYTNVGTDANLFLSLQTAADEWPPTSKYESGESGPVFK
jgi:quercetin dioxygenase-like cupin family protein